MATLRITRGKYDRINRCADERGVIAAAAMDQRGSLQKSIAKARGGDAGPADLAAFKGAVSAVLTPHSSAILLDPEYGLDAIGRRAPGRGVLLAYEKTGYDATVSGRLPDVLPEWSARRLLEAGADAIKILLYYNPDDTPATNRIKHAWVERIGGECAANDIPLFLEPLFYDESAADDVELARRKPSGVTRIIAEFSNPRYGVDILKVEVPFNIKHVAGSQAHVPGGAVLHTQEEAMALFREASSAATKPFIFLSAGVSNEVFIETLEMAAQAGTRFAGVLCGRATWQGGIPVYAQHGEKALVDWLSTQGVANIEALNQVLGRAARPWWETYGGREQIEVVDLVVG